MRKSSITSLAAGFSIVSGLPLENDAAEQSPSIQPRAPWQPAVGSSWQIVLSQTLKLDSQNPSVSPNVDIFDIDMFMHRGTSTIASLHKLNKKVICYFSAGSYEPARPDSSLLTSSVRGLGLDGWPGEFWLDIRSPIVRGIMAARVLVAAQMGCDAIDPDNVDGYQNSNGLQLTAQDSIDFIKFLAAEAAKYNMGIGLKNALDLIPSVLPYVQFAVNEQCAQYDECADLRPFIAAGKPVFHIEYTDASKLRRSLTRRGTSRSKAFVRLGCYVDSTEQRVLQADFDDDDDMTPQMCQRYCSDYTYFGLKRGNQCYCSNKMTTSVKQPDSECKTACEGDDSQTCGGRKRIEVYQISSSSISTTMKPTTVPARSSSTTSTTTTKKKSTSMQSPSATSTLSSSRSKTTTTTTTASPTRAATTQRTTTFTTTTKPVTTARPSTTVASDSTSKNVCSTFQNINGFSTVIKKLALDSWVRYCNGQVASTSTQ